MKWVGIRLEVEVGEGVVFVRNPFVLAGVASPGSPGSLTVRLGNRVRLAPGVAIEAEPGRDSLLQVGDGTRIGATSHFHLGGGAILIGASSEIRDGCVLRTSGGVIELGDHCFLGSGCRLHATERIIVDAGVALGEHVVLLDA
jgi:hypothetical protein